MKYLKNALVICILIICMIINNVVYTSTCILRSNYRFNSRANFTTGYVKMSYDNTDAWSYYSALGIYLGKINTTNNSASLAGVKSLNYYTKTITITNIGSLPVDVNIDESDTLSGDLLSILNITTTVSSSGKNINTITQNRKWIVYNLLPNETISIKVKINILLQVAVGNNYNFNIYYNIKGKQNNDLSYNENSTLCYFSNTVMVTNKITMG